MYRNAERFYRIYSAPPQRYRSIDPRPEALPRCVFEPA